MMKWRGKSTPFAELLVMMGALLPICACSWTNPWRSGSATAEDGSAAAGEDKPAKKEIPQVKLSRDEQKIYDKYHSSPGMATGLSDQSRAVESRLGYK